MPKSSLYLLLAILLGALSGLSNWSPALHLAEGVSTLFMNFLKFISAPLVFLSIFSTLSGMTGFGEMRTLGRRVFSYTILTTLLAATTALCLFLLIDPARSPLPQSPDWDASAISQASYLSFFTNIVPSNWVQAFLENNVIGLSFLGFLLGLAALQLPPENKEVLNRFFSSFFKLILKLTEMILVAMPFGVWAFVTLLVVELRQNGSSFRSLILYLSVVLGANLLQGLLVLPLFLKSKGLSPWRVAKGASRALLLAFFSKSSNATLPVTLRCAENNLGIQPKVAHFSLPLCTVINMNGCAAFILTTVLFISQMNGLLFSPWDLALWVLLATLAAIGNAGVPMGCFFLSSAFLIAMDVPMALMGLILPFYAFLDMVETALNVWSDIAVTAVIDKELRAETQKSAAF